MLNNVSLQLNFGPNGASFNLDTEVFDFGSDVQNAMVCLGTSAGSDLTFPAKGTDLLAQALATGFINTLAAEANANFASLDTLFFLRAQDLNTSIERLQGIQLSVTSFTGQTLSLSAQITSTLGTVVGVNAVNNVTAQ